MEVRNHKDRHDPFYINRCQCDVERHTPRPAGDVIRLSRAAWGANGVSAKAAVEAHAAISEAVEIGGFVDPTTVTAHGMRRVIIGHDKNNIGPRLTHFTDLNSFN